MNKINELSNLISGRDKNLFADDLVYFEEHLKAVISKSRVLIIGGAGSIGSSTVKILCNYKPKHICVVDTNENNLTELTRLVRNSQNNELDFLTLPISFGSEHMHKFISDAEPYDFVLNFAALKHVRSEKNVVSILQMLQTNALDVLKCLKWLSEKNDSLTFFNVSTDKAANPVNVLGASKQMMENLIFSFNDFFKTNITFISSRFANVAVSDGSLFHSYLFRFENGEPLPVPRNTKRFFISLEEAGSICILSAFCGEQNQIYIPKLNEKDLQVLETVAEKVISNLGFTPKQYYNEIDATINIKKDISEKFYPLLVTNLDTMGEKDFEEFENDDEVPQESNIKSLRKIEFLNRGINIIHIVEELEHFNQNLSIKNRFDELMHIIDRGAFNFKHKNSTLTLDDRK